MDNLVYFTDAKFNASLKGIIDIQGRMTEAFSLVIALESRNPTSLMLLRFNSHFA